jgi:hypothetical protein
MPLGGLRAKLLELPDVVGGSRFRILRLENHVQARSFKLGYCPAKTGWCFWRKSVASKLQLVHRGRIFRTSV